MTVYVSKGFETNQLKEIESDKDDFETIVSSKVMTFEDVSSIDSIKRYQAYFFIPGELSEPTRKNDNVLNKTLVTLDYDDLEMTEEEFKAHLMSKISVLKFLSYPSISNGLKGTRYRVIIPTDRPYTREESTTVIQFITEVIGLPYDAASETWSQLQGLKCTFESEESFEGKCLLNEGRGLLKIENALQKMKERKPKRTGSSKPAFTVSYTRKKTYTAKFLEEIVAGAGEGERNQFITSKLGKLFSLGMEAEKVYELIHAINQYFLSPPLDDSEINKTFESILKADTKKMSKGGFD
ncbi:primase alpha helix C-terminal domain-containing protein [Alkalibacterium gilvum]|uniref:primase alpha helix C-terminal domain-containing protein n=1 Tax=Alkalibacterium gilvum TaxID=1130080 RepID=UPI003F90E25B